MKTFLSIFLLASVFNCLSQQLNQNKYLYADVKMVFNVKQFNQFINRFNYAEDFTGNKIDPDFMAKFPREKYLHYLFDANDSRIKTSDVGLNPYQTLIEEFINYVDSNTLTVSRTSENIFVEARCNILYKGQPKLLKILLRQEFSNGGVKWVIHDVLNIDDIVDRKAVSETRAFIPPTSNELNFTHLQRAFDDKENFREYLKENFRTMPLNILLEEVENGNIVYQHVNKMIYNIFDISGWIIRVEEFIRDDISSGWLISNIEKWQGDPLLYFKGK